MTAASPAATPPGALSAGPTLPPEVCAPGARAGGLGAGGRPATRPHGDPVTGTAGPGPRRPAPGRVKGGARVTAPGPPAFPRRPGLGGGATRLLPERTTGDPGGAERRGCAPAAGRTRAGTGPGPAGREGRGREPTAIFPRGQTDRARPRGRAPTPPRRARSRDTARASGKRGGGKSR